MLWLLNIFCLANIQTKSRFGFKKRHVFYNKANESVLTTHALTHASAKNAVNWIIGHFQLPVSRFMMAMVLMHCKANA
jgi:hypothetical protein